MTVLYDARGNPIETRNLDKEHGAPGGPWVTLLRESVADTINPARLGALLRAADQGDHEAYFTLAEEMEERDLHYRGVLSTRRVAVTGLSPAVVPVDESDEERAIADAVERDIVNRPEFCDLVFEMMDAIGKGYAIVEILWDKSSPRWRPRGYRWRDPRHYLVDPYTLDRLRLQDSADPKGKALPAGKYCIHHPKLKSGAPLRSGLARLAGIAYACKRYNIRDLSRFLEVYGIPPRIGKHHAGASADDKRRLLDAVRKLGNDAAAIVPENMSVEFMDVPRGTSVSAFLDTSEWWDRQVSKAVLGQTSSSDGGAGDYKASAQHQGVRLSFARHDAMQIAARASEDVVRPYVELNFGAREHYPQITLPVPIPEDLTKFAAAVTPFIDRGLAVSATSVREKLGLREPKEGETLLEKAAKQGPQTPFGDAPGAQEPADA